MPTQITGFKITPKTTSKKKTNCIARFKAYAQGASEKTEFFILKIRASGNEGDKIKIKRGGSLVKSLPFQRKISRIGTAVEKDFQLIIEGSADPKNIKIELCLKARPNKVEGFATIRYRPN